MVSDDGARLQGPGRQDSHFQTSLKSILFPSFFQVILRDTRPGLTKSVKVELNP